MFEFTLLELYYFEFTKRILSDKNIFIFVYVTKLKLARKFKRPLNAVITEIYIFMKLLLSLPTLMFVKMLKQSAQSCLLKHVVEFEQN